MTTCGISTPFGMLSPTSGQVAYVLRDRSPLGPKSPFDLHFLGTPQAFVLSQDQTLQRRVHNCKKRSPGKQNKRICSDKIKTYAKKLLGITTIIDPQRTWILTMDAHYLVCKKLLEEQSSIHIQSTWAPDARGILQHTKGSRKEKGSRCYELG